MRDKIIARLRALYPGVNLSKERLNAIADKLSSKITEETEIDTKLNELNDLIPFADMAKQDDRLRTLEAKNKPPEPPKPADPPPGDPPPANETPEWAKSLMAEVASLKKEKVQHSMLSKAEAALKEVPKSYWHKRALPEKEEDLQAFVDDVNSDYTAFKQEQIDAGLMSQTPPGGGGGNGGGGAVSEKVVEAEIKAWADKGKETAKA